MKTQTSTKASTTKNIVSKKSIYDMRDALREDSDDNYHSQFNDYDSYTEGLTYGLRSGGVISGTSW